MINKINCTTCRALVSLFYSTSMNKSVREAILYHLINCSNCLNIYEGYEQKHKKLSFTGIRKIIEKLKANNIDNVRNSADLSLSSSYTFDSNDDGEHFNPKKWQDAAATFDIETLMNLKFFRDLINSYDYSKTYSDLDYSGFYKHIARKITKRLDLLEACWRKDPVEHTVTNS